MTANIILGKSQSEAYDGDVEAEIGIRVRARMHEVAAGLTQAQIAERIGLAPDAFSRSLNGKRVFSAVELVKLAELLQTSAHWFVTGEEDPFALRVAGRHVFDHDTREHVSVDWDGHSEPLTEIATAYRQVADQVAASAVPTKHSAAALRAHLERTHGTGFVRHLADALESEFGIDVVRVDSIQQAFALEILHRSVIVVAETSNWFFENWSLAHELGHIAAGDLATLGDRACDDPRTESRANAFAADLLLPRPLVSSVNWSTASVVDVARFVWDAGISTDALRRRLKKLQIVGNAAVDEALTKKTQALLRQTRIPEGTRDLISDRMAEASQRRFPTHLIAAHREGVAEGRLTADTLGWMLGVEPALLEESLAPDPRPADIDWLARELGLGG